ncbi:cytochrome P450 [Streptomyces cacaoi]|uniref:cytochrome P450 n=1 Tax=Streptomyces cacaoi TaxID=1898 RepID=UPI002633943E|nr:cytochrome P450 [Streptomyces cacaoi]
MAPTTEAPAQAWTHGRAPGGRGPAGHALSLARTPLSFLTSLPRYGDLVELRLGHRRAYLACHPDLVRHILLDSKTFDSGGALKDKARLILGNGLITAGRQDHRKQRRMIQPAFHQRRIASYARIMQQECAQICDSWHASRPVDMCDAMHALTARVTARCLFSTNIAQSDVREIQQWLPVVIRGAFHRALDPTGLLERVPTRGNRRFDEALTRLNSLITRLVSRYRARGAGGQDLLSALLETEDTKTGSRLSDQEIHDQVMTLLLAGIETTASALTWSLHLLSRHPGVADRLVAETDEVLGGRAATYEDIPALPYTSRVFNETLRMFPPAWVFTRTTVVDTRLAGHRLPSGADILISPYVLHRNPRLFPEPRRFDPDRWAPERAAGIPSGAMLPFGAGSRKCIGDVFGMTEAVLALATLTTRWKMTLAPGAKVRPKAAMSLGSGPLPMVLTPRDK